MEPAPTPPPPATPAERYAALARSWWTAAMVVLAAPIIIFKPALRPAPPPVGPWEQFLHIAQVVVALFAIGSLVLYFQWRLRLPEVTRPRWYAPSVGPGRRLGFWLLWLGLATYGWFTLGLLAPKVDREIRLGNPAAYLHADPTAFAIERLPNGTVGGLIHLVLRNDGKYPIPIPPEPRLGTVSIETPMGAYLMGKARLALAVECTPAQLPLNPFPAAFLPGESYEFLIPFASWGKVVDGVPGNLEIDFSYTPLGGLMGPSYQPLDLYAGPVAGVPAP
ncbi:MAG: hypothetical protein ABI743_00555 [bacterium]